MQARCKVWRAARTTIDVNTPSLAAAVPRPSLDRRFDELIETYRAPLTRLVAAYEANRAERQDLLQDIWLAIWRALPRFRGECSERTFVYRVAHNRAITHASRHRLDTTDIDTVPELTHSAPHAEQSVDTVQTRARLLAAVRRLPLTQREVVTLCLEGLPHRDIAQVLGITENNVAVRLARARTELQRLMGDPS